MGIRDYLDLCSEARDEVREGLVVLLIQAEEHNTNDFSLALARKLSSNSFASWLKDKIEKGFSRLYHIRVGPWRVVGKARHIKKCSRKQPPQGSATTLSRRRHVIPKIANPPHCLSLSAGTHPSSPKSPAVLSSLNPSCRWSEYQFAGVRSATIGSGNLMGKSVEEAMLGEIEGTPSPSEAKRRRRCVQSKLCWGRPRGDDGEAAETDVVELGESEGEDTEGENTGKRERKRKPKAKTPKKVISCRSVFCLGLGLNI
ncbi:hypothetical protein B296_00027752 [Ensete ventricosum]|uniref:Uncharacterized protein n=1 Tax=Ensete ventricosum TaxID=4639 RepID=A0A427ALZ5_ENSVE|nr:hypothetical protein B296_00027752 [Ensete ventricosum]